MYIYEFDILLDKTLDNIYKDINISKIKLKDLEKKIDCNKYLSNFETLKNNNNYEEIQINTLILINMYIYFVIFINDINNLDDIKTFLIKRKTFDTNNLGYLINIFHKYNYLNEILEIFNNKEKLLELYKNDINYKDVIDILNEYGLENVNSNLFINNLNEKNHNIIKLFIFKKVYAPYYRKKIFNLIFLNNSKKIRLNIVVPKKLKLDFFNIESFLTYNEKKLGIANEIINLFEELNAKILDTDDQIIDILLNSKLFIPITDEFLRYHKILEKINFKTDVKRSRIKTILNKNDQIKEYYSLKVKNNKSLLNEISKYFYKPLIHRKAILYNEFDELNIIQKIKLAGSDRIIDNNEFLDLKDLRRSNYVNFRNFKNNGISYLSDKNFTCVRYAGIESLENKTLMDKSAKLEYKNATRDKAVNLVGLCILKNQDVKIKDLKNVRDVNNNGIEACKELLVNKINNKLNDNYYWIFDKNKDILLQDDFDLNLSNFDLNIIFKYLINFIKNEVTIFIKKKLEKYNSLDFYYYKKFIKYYSNKFLKFHINRKSYNLNDLRITKNQLVKKTEDIIDDTENKLYGVLGKVIKKVRDNNIIKSDNIKYIPYSENENEIVIEESNVYCQHLIDWNKIQLVKTKNVNLHKELLYNFIKKYVITNLENEYICKSCKQYVEVKNYLYDSYDGLSGIDLVINNRKKLSDIKEYEKYSITIKNLDKIIETIARINNLGMYIGNEPIVKIRREDIVKNVIDLINLHERTLKVKNMSNLDRQSDASRKFGINTKFTNFFIFPITNDLFKSSSEEKDKFKRIKINTIIVYIILFMILDLNDSQIIMIEFNKICNNLIYEKVKSILFSNLKIVVDNKLNKINLLENELLCFLIYYFSCNLSMSKTWFSPVSDISIKQKTIINTFFDFCNSLLEIFSFKKKNYMYEMICGKIINMFNSFKRNKDLLDILIEKNKKVIQFDKDKKKILIKKNAIKSINLDNFKEIEFDVKKFDFTNFKLPIKNPKRIILDKKYIDDIYSKYKLNFENKIISNFNKNGFKRNVILDLNEVKKLDDRTKQEILENYKETNQLVLPNIKKESKVSYKKIAVEKNVIDKFINLIKIILKKDSIIIKNKEYYLNKSILHINFDFLGNIIKTSKYVDINDKKVSIKMNTYFNMYVYEIYDKVNEIKLILNQYNLHYLGYLNKNEITDLRKLNLYAIYIPSIKEQFETLGFKKNYYKKDEIIKLIINNSINNLKMYISILKNQLYLIKFKKINNSDLIDYYINRISNLNMSKKDGNFFDDFECIQFSKINETYSEKYFEIISKYDLKNYSNSYNTILNYFLDNIIKLVEVNKNNFNKVNILEFIILNNFDNYISNYEQFYNFEIRKFSNIYNLDMCQELVEKYDESEFINEINDKQKEEIENQIIDEIEKNDALDIDDINNEGDDDEDVMFYNDEN